MRTKVYILIKMVRSPSIISMLEGIYHYNLNMSILDVHCQTLIKALSYDIKINYDDRLVGVYYI